ncbi:MAG: nitrilase-related carbon-nitrogen hydrolase [Polyangiales bacterium]
MSERPVSRWFLAGVYTGSAVALCLATAEPRLWPCAWLAVAFAAAALARTPAVSIVFVGTWLTHAAALMVGSDWLLLVNEKALDMPGGGSLAFLLLEVTTWATPLALTVSVGHALAARRVPVALWLPIAWGAGEALRFAVLGVDLGDWLMTQWQAPLVLRMLGHLGWWPTTWVCLTAAASMGEAIALRSPRFALAALPAVVLAVAAPPLPSRGVETLEGLAVAHTRSTVDLPHRLPPAEGTDDRLDLVVWPEDAYALRPYLVEGDGSGTRLEPWAPGAHADHLIGLTTASPSGGQLNQAVAVNADGLVLGARAKRHMLPLAERRVFGFGDDRWRPGRVAPLLRVGGTRVIPILCGELFSRAVAAEGRRAGGEVLAVLARDQMMGTPRGRAALLAVQVMRSVELGVPSVRASYAGEASFVSSDGRVLAQSRIGTNGFLRWDRAHGAREFDFRGARVDGARPANDAPRVTGASHVDDRPHVTATSHVDTQPETPRLPAVAVLHAADGPEFRTRCPEGRCAYHPIEHFECAGQRAETVILAGHAAPPGYLGASVADIADAIQCFQPSLVVVDTCFGASAELLEALAGSDVFVVGAPFLVPSSGLRYEPGFFEEGPADERAQHVHDPHGRELFRWRAAREPLHGALRDVERWTPSELRDRVVRRDPTYVRAELAGAGPFLVPVTTRTQDAHATTTAANRRARAVWGSSNAAPRRLDRP